MSCSDSGRSLLLIAAATALAMAEGRSQDELNALAVFFNMLSDNLAALALSAPTDHPA